jgi:hypothetical protein
MWQWLRKYRQRKLSKMPFTDPPLPTLEEDYDNICSLILATVNGHRARRILKILTVSVPLSQDAQD